jgi:hypothetical protein
MTKNPDKEFCEDPTDLHRAVGSALAMWSLVERGLVSALRSIAKIESYAVSEAIIASNKSFRGRIELIDTILLVEPMPDNAMNAWKILKKRLSKCNSERNGLDHFTIVHHTENKPCDGYAVAPLYSPVISAAKGEPLLLTLSEIANIEERFLQLGGDLEWFDRENGILQFR